MKRQNKKIQYILLMIVFITINITNIYAQKSTSNKASAENSVLYIVDGGNRSRVQKYLYKDLMKSSVVRNSKLKLSIEFMDFDEAQKTVFEQYDVVIVVNQKSTDALQPHVLKFVQKHQDKKNMIVTAFLPKGKSSLKETNGIDVISSASYERPAAKLVEKEVAREVVSLLE